MQTFNAADIKRLGHGDTLRVAGEYGGVIFRRTPDETRGRIHGRKRAEYVITCPLHLNERNRYANTLKLAVSMAEDTSLWCRDCRAAWLEAHTEGKV